MATINISLPVLMKEWVEQQSKGGLYSNASDYVRGLIRCDQERAKKIAAMQARVTEGIASGVSESSIEAIREKARQRAEA